LLLARNSHCHEGRSRFVGIRLALIPIFGVSSIVSVWKTLPVLCALKSGADLCPLLNSVQGDLAVKGNAGHNPDAVIKRPPEQLAAFFGQRDRERPRGRIAGVSVDRQRMADLIEEVGGSLFIKCGGLAQMMRGRGEDCVAPKPLHHLQKERALILKLGPRKDYT